MERAGDFTRPKPDVFVDFTLGQEHIPIETPPRPYSNMFMPEQMFAIATDQCVTAGDKNH